MATAEGISVSVESAVHDALRRVLQNIFDAHGISVKSVDVDWLDASTNAMPRAFVTNLRIISTTDRYCVRESE